MKDESIERRIAEAFRAVTPDSRIFCQIIIGK